VHTSKACYQFAKELQPGDKVLIKKGLTQVLALGEVTSGYRYDASRREYRSVRQVRWLATGQWTLPREHRLQGKTLTDITNRHDLLNYVLPLIKKGTIEPRPVPPLFSIEDALQDVFLSKEAFVDMLDALARKRNLILEGPPGVGKTFLARRLAYAQSGYKDRRRSIDSRQQATSACTHRRATQLVRVCNQEDMQWETKVVKGTRIRAGNNEPQRTQQRSRRNRINRRKRDKSEPFHARLRIKTN
jgi:hypothetical protein